MTWENIVVENLKQMSQIHPISSRVEVGSGMLWSSVESTLDRNVLLPTSTLMG